MIEREKRCLGLCVRVCVCIQESQYCRASHYSMLEPSTWSVIQNVHLLVIWRHQLVPTEPKRRTLIVRTLKDVIFGGQTCPLLLLLNSLPYYRNIKHAAFHQNNTSASMAFFLLTFQFTTMMSWYPVFFFHQQKTASFLVLTPNKKKLVSSSNRHLATACLLPSCVVQHTLLAPSNTQNWWKLGLAQ